MRKDNSEKIMVFTKNSLLNNHRILEKGENMDFFLNPKLKKFKTKKTSKISESEIYKSSLNNSKEKKINKKLQKNKFENILKVIERKKNKKNIIFLKKIKIIQNWWKKIIKEKNEKSFYNKKIKNKITKKIKSKINFSLEKLKKQNELKIKNEDSLTTENFLKIKKSINILKKSKKEKEDCLNFLKKSKIDDSFNLSKNLKKSKKEDSLKKSKIEEDSLILSKKENSLNFLKNLKNQNSFNFLKNLKNPKNENSLISSQKQKTVLSQISQKMEIPDISLQNKIIEKSQKNLKEETNAKELLKMYEEISKEQLTKWKIFYDKIQKFEKDQSNPILKKVKNESKQAIQFLIEKTQKNKNFENKNFEKKKEKKNFQKQKKILNRFYSIDSKSKEKFLIPDENLAHKNAYDIIRDKYFKTGRMSKSVIFPKSLTEKSCKSDFEKSYLLDFENGKKNFEYDYAKNKNKKCFDFENEKNKNFFDFENGIGKKKDFFDIKDGFGDGSRIDLSFIKIDNLDKKENFVKKISIEKDFLENNVIEKKNNIFNNQNNFNFENEGNDFVKKKIIDNLNIEEDNLEKEKNNFVIEKKNILENKKNIIVNYEKDDFLKEKEEFLKQKNDFLKERDNFLKEKNKFLKKREKKENLPKTINNKKEKKNLQKQLEKIKKPEKKKINKNEIVEKIFENLLNNLINDSLFKKLIKKKKNLPGIKIDIYSIHKYLNEISEYLIFTNLPKIKENLNFPNPKKKILKQSYFLEYQKTNNKKNYPYEYQNELSQIFNKCIFDTLNQALNFQTINLQFGKLQSLYFYNKFFFLITNTNNKNKKVIDNYNYLYDDIGSITALEKACNKLLNWNDLMCGFMIDKEEVEGVFKEFDYIKQIKEERMLKLIYNDVKESDKEWFGFYEEFGEVFKEVEEFVFDFLVRDLKEFFF